MKSAEHSCSYDASRPDIAAKRFLNYLRRHKKERPKSLEIQWTYNHRPMKADATVEWYTGKLRNSSFEGPEGEWWNLVSVIIR